MKSKKIIWWVLGIVVVAAVAGGFGIHAMFRGGDTYYTQITTDGHRDELKDDNGGTVIDYKYEQAVYNDKGEKITVEFYGNKPRPLKQKAYLKLVVNYSHDSVRSWEQVSKAKVPKKALAKLSSK